MSSKGRSELPTWSLSLPAVKEKVAKREIPKIHVFDHVKKRGKKPSVLYYVPGTLTCTHLPSCNTDERQVFLLPSSQGKTEAQRSMGPDCQGGTGGSAMSAPRVVLVPPLHLQVPRE